jgi:hypothetical protein
VGLRFRPEARLDILEARAWYEERAKGLGSEFARSVDAASSGVLRFPKAFPKLHGEVRKAVLRRFPYSLLFIIEQDYGVVLGCFHHRRKPRTWDHQS